MREKTRAMDGERPSSGVSPPETGAEMATARLRSVLAGSRELRSAAAVRTVARSRSFAQGLETKSVEPRFTASTEILTHTLAVCLPTTAPGSRFRIPPRQVTHAAQWALPRPHIE